MRTPMPIVKNQNAAANVTSISIDINYADSFCTYLKANKIEIEPSKIAEVEFGWDHDQNSWEFIGNTIRVGLVLGFTDLAGSWLNTIPPQGL